MAAPRGPPILFVHIYKAPGSHLWSLKSDMHMEQPGKLGWGLRTGQDNVLGPLRYWLILTDRVVVPAGAHDPLTWGHQRSELK